MGIFDKIQRRLRGEVKSGADVQGVSGKDVQGVSDKAGADARGVTDKVGVGTLLGDLDMSGLAEDSDMSLLAGEFDVMGELDEMGALLEGFDELSKLLDDDVFGDGDF